jgi:hypothetical protein
MADFNQTRDQLSAARSQREQARQSLFQAQESLKGLQALRAASLRSFNEDDQDQVARKKVLDEQEAALKAKIQRLQKTAATATDNEGQWSGRFHEFTDPRKGIENLSDATPFLLFPVRMETRFKTVSNNLAAAGQRQLLVRVYPDECLVDTFEETLSKQEIDSAQRYWVDYWRAGKVEELRRAAWRGLVASHGSGRALWIRDHYPPLNPGDEPHRAAADDIVLVIATDDPPPAPEQAAALPYWAAVWSADGDAAKEQAAFNTLKTNIGSAAAANIRDNFAPGNLTESPRPPKKKSDVAASAGFLIFPKPEDVPAKQRSWTQPARAAVLPDRFVLIGYSGGKKVLELVGNPVPSPLVVGPDPNAPPDQQLRQKDGEIVVDDEMKWMVDFDRAVQVGMGFRVNLEPAQTVNGFERLVVLGVRLSSKEDEGRLQLENLFRHHQFGRSGLTLLPQGTPTNNTEDADSGFTGADDADASYDDYFTKDALFTETADWWSKSDGQWLAEALGIDSAALKKVRNSGGTDQAEARAMNAALWPATLGYTLATMLHPLFERDDVEAVRWFFTRFVSGRGAVPAIRVGKQPYGILPTTAFYRVRWLGERQPVLPEAPPAGFAQSVARVYEVLNLMGPDWAALSGKVTRVPSTAGDPHQTLLDIIGLHPASVEFYQRYAKSLDDLFNRAQIEGFASELIAFIVAAGYVEGGKQLLRKLGYTGDAVPDVLNHLFLDSSALLKGPVVDDRPLSESAPVREYTADHRNYLQWLIDAAKTSADALRAEAGFINNQPPTALLYMLLRHALDLAFWDTSVRLHLDHNVIDVPTARLAQRELPFIHVSEANPASESRWAYLYKTEPAITGSPSLQIGKFISTIIGFDDAAEVLVEMLAAIERLHGVSTARLERLLAEHLDCCSYRLDAWEQGIIQYGLAQMRYRRQDDNDVAATPGIFIGAYGWLEDVAPKPQPEPVELDPELSKVFAPPGSTPLVHDTTNEGYIHAPSLSHAVTAAVLRNGYITNASKEEGKILAVNLSSERVRVALAVLEGIRQGQTLSALLGYQLERGLHDRYKLAHVDEFIYPLRKQFPLRSDRLDDTKTDLTIPIQAVEARNVVDGLSLIDHLKKTNNFQYPFGLPLPAADNNQKAAINAEVERLLDTNDAVADVAIAESVYHAVQSNYDRAAANLDAYSKGQHPPEPQVVRTPRTGRTLTHRFAVQLESGLDEDVSPVVGLPVTPRATAEPAVNAWLAGLLPAPEDVACTVSYFDVGAMQQAVVTQRDLGLQPIDVLQVATLENLQAAAELDDRILLHVHKNLSPRPDSLVTIQYSSRIAGKITFFELAPLLRSLRAIVLRSRPLRVTDLSLQNEATRGQEQQVFVKPDRIHKVRDGLDTLHTDVDTLRTALKALHDDEVANRDAIIAGIDGHLTSFVDLYERAGRFGIPATGWGFALDWKHNQFANALLQIANMVASWQAKLTDFDDRMTAYDSLPGPTPAANRFADLAPAEALVSTTLTVPFPATPAAFRTLLDGKRTAFVTRLDALGVELNTATIDVSGLLSELTDLIQGVPVTDPPPMSDFDPEPLDVKPLEDEVVTFSADLLNRLTVLATSIHDRQIKPVDALLVQHDAESQPAVRAQILDQAVKILLGEDFRLVPEFVLENDQGNELENAVHVSQSGQLLDFQVNTRKKPFPIDTWLYGVARVREKVQHWEQLVMLSGAFGQTEPELMPIQLPFHSDDSWLALEYPADYRFDGDRLLYTVHFATGAFDKTQPQCGVLLDEWTEVVPGETETTGITFHFDRPNAEPPQAIVLVVPPAFTGAWHWDDVVDAVNETLERAKRRAVEPTQIDDTAYARLLPATIASVTLYQISIMLNWAENNRVSQVVKVANG